MENPVQDHMAHQMLCAALVRQDFISAQDGSPLLRQVRLEPLDIFVGH